MVETVREVLPHVPLRMAIDEVRRTRNPYQAVNRLLSTAGAQ